MGCGIESADRAFIRIVDAALAEAARKSGPWLACRIGCTQCCVGPFRISQLDAWRLRRGLESLDERDPGRAARVRRRVRESVERLSPGFPGDPATGILLKANQPKRVSTSLPMTNHAPRSTPKPEPAISTKRVP
jgi:hypothetical protein